MADNMERLGTAVGDIEAVVLSHGHFDHAGGFPRAGPNSVGTAIHLEAAAAAA
jgi:metal-dependent hydrolase (beta-lactamase superfamily II)